MTQPLHASSLEIPRLLPGEFIRTYGLVHLQDDNAAMAWTVRGTSTAISFTAMGTRVQMPAAQRAGLAVPYLNWWWMADRVTLHHAGGHTDCELFEWCRLEPVSPSDGWLPSDMLTDWCGSGCGHNDMFERLQDLLVSRIPS